MNPKRHLLRSLAIAGASLALATAVVAQEVVRIAGTTCETPPPLKCPDEGCVGDAAGLVTEGGPVIEEETDRNYFLDYPCDLQPGEDVTFILSLHGGGSYGNWQRHYFPIVDYKDEHRLVIATPYSPARVWRTTDDEYLRNIVTFVIDEIGADNIRSFWLAGHSQGGLTSRRLVCTEFFRDKVDGFLSLSGGRLGGQAPISFGRRSASDDSDVSDARDGADAADDDDGSGDGGPGSVFSAPPELDCDFSHIYETGEHELVDGLASLPTTSTLAEKFECSARVQRDDVVDTRGGYVSDGRSQENPNPAWGLLPGPGRAEVFVYPDCDDGRVVADIVRMGKGHTEGLEPNVTEALVRLMVSARGGKIQPGD